MMAAGGVAGLASAAGGLGGSVAANVGKTALQGGFNTGLQSATSGSFDPKSAALNFIPGVSAGPAGSLKNTLVQTGLERHVDDVLHRGDRRGWNRRDAAGDGADMFVE